MTIKTDLIQTGASVTTSQLFTQRAPNDGTFRISRGAAGATTEDNLVIGATGKLTGTVVQSSATDATAGALMTVGAFGLGGLGVLNINDLNSNPATGLYTVNSASINGPASLFGSLYHTHYEDINWTQWVQELGSGKAWVRGMINGSLGAWQQVMTSATSLGVNQTWQDVTGSRALATTYTNSTGRPIALSITATAGTTVNSFWTLSINGVATAQSTQVYSASAVCTLQQFIIPAGATYALTVNGTAPINKWWELR